MAASLVRVETLLVEEALEQDHVRQTRTHKLWSVSERLVMRSC